MSDITVPAAAPVPAPVVVPVPVVADKGTSVVKDLMTPTTVRADIVAILGVVGVVAGALGHKFNIPTVPDAALTVISGLVVITVQAVRNMVHGAVTRAALQNDAVFLKTSLPQVQAEVAALKPIADQLPALQAAVTEASDNASAAKTSASAAADGLAALQGQVDALPAAQKDQVEAALRALLAGMVPSPVAPASAPSAAVAL